MTHICVSKLTTFGSDNGLSPSRHQAIIWTNVAILLIGHLTINFSDYISRNLTIFFLQENAFENVSKMADILSLLQCVKQYVMRTKSNGGVSRQICRHANERVSIIYRVNIGVLMGIRTSAKIAFIVKRGPGDSNPRGQCQVYDEFFIIVSLRERYGNMILKTWSG